MLHWAISLHSCMFKSLHEQIPKLEVRPSIMVVDFATYAGFDVADYFGIPFGQQTFSCEQIDRGNERGKLCAAVAHSVAVSVLLSECSRQQRRFAQHTFTRRCDSVRFPAGRVDWRVIGRVQRASQLVRSGGARAVPPSAHRAALRGGIHH